MLAADYDGSAGIPRGQYAVKVNNAKFDGAMAALQILRKTSHDDARNRQAWIGLASMA